MNCFVIIKEILIALAALIGSVVAIAGLTIWRKQLKGKVTFELSRRLLTNTYLLREAIKSVRNPLMYEGKKPPNDSPYYNDTKGENYYFQLTGYEIRFKYVDDAKSKLNSDILESEVFWGKDLKNAYDELFKLLNKLSVGIQMFLERNNPKSIHDIQYSKQQLLEEKNIMYKIYDDSKDEFENQVNNSITKIESLIRPHLDKFK
ncbi:MAG: hypothetical protein HZB41_05125 [Ignavibacteriae bacterium]|nr:hypothetical protein [Ignavibacteriota bacterium]